MGATSAATDSMYEQVWIATRRSVIEEQRRKNKEQRTSRGGELDGEERRHCYEADDVAAEDAARSSRLHVGRIDAPAEASRGAEHTHGRQADADGGGYERHDAHPQRRIAADRLRDQRG